MRSVKIFPFIFLGLLFFNSTLVFSADWYCRPWKESGYGDNSGTSYKNAWPGLSYRVTASLDHTKNEITLANDGMSTGINNTNSPIFFTVESGGKLPNEIAIRKVYYAKRTGDFTFTITEIPGSNDLEFSSNGSGTIYCNIGIDWDSVSPGDTIYLCGDFGSDETFPKIGTRVNTTSRAHTVLNLRKSGIPSYPITIRGDHSSYPGRIFRSTAIFQPGCGEWERPDPINAPNVYRNRYAPGSINRLLENEVLMNTKKNLSSPPTLTELQGMKPGDWGFYNYYIYVYPKESANSNPNYNKYICASYPDNVILADSRLNVNYINIINVKLYLGDMLLYDVDNIKIDGVDIIYSKESIQFYPNNKNIYGCIVSNCNISHAYANGIYFHKGNYNFVNNIIENNSITNILDPDNIGGCIKSDHHAIGINTGTGYIIRNNYIKNAATGITIYTDSYALSANIYSNYCEWFYRNHNKVYGNYVLTGHGCGLDYSGPPVPSVKVDINIFNNIIKNASNMGIRTVPAPNENLSVKVYNNVVDNCNIGIGSYSGEDGLKIDIRNNIIKNPTDFGDGLPVCFIYARANGNTNWKGYIINNNNYYTDNPLNDMFYHYDGEGGLKTWSEWKSIIQKYYSSNENYSIKINPLFINSENGDYRLSSDSPCIASGNNVGLSMDYKGNKWRNPPSMGAIEYYKIGGVISPKNIGGSNYKPK